MHFILKATTCRCVLQMFQPEILLVNDIWACLHQVKNILTEVIILQTGRKYEKNNTLLITYCIVHHIQVQSYNIFSC